MKILLVLTLLVAGADKPAQFVKEQPSVDACLAEAADRLSHEPPGDSHPLLLGAACIKVWPKDNPA